MRVKLISSSAGLIVHYGLISSSLRMVVGATSVIYLTSHGVSLAQIGAMKAMQAALILVLDLPLSYLADRTSRIYVPVGGNVATALWLGTTACSTSALGFFLAETFNAIGLAAFSGVFTALLIDTYEKEHQRVVPRENWSMTESAISSFTRVLFIATLPFVGAFGDRACAQAIFIFILLFMSGSFLCLALGGERRFFS